MLSDTIHCRYCGGRRKVSPGGICTGCGSPADEALSVTRKERHCPKCTDGTLKINQVSRISICSSCGHDEQTIRRPNR